MPAILRILQIVLLSILGISEPAWASAASSQKNAPNQTGSTSTGPSLSDSKKYIHNWVGMPSFVAPSLPQPGEQITVAHRYGRVLVLIFIASWCEPCQELMPAIKTIVQRYENLNTDFVYVFAHDTPQDAEGFMKEYKLPSGVLASYEALKAYHNPPLPSVYVGDRQGWLATRFLATRLEDLDKLNEYLKYWTAY